jgi:hypothetical protein
MNRITIFASAIAALAVGAPLHKADAANFKLLQSGSVIIEGEFMPDDHIRLTNAIAQQNRRGKRVERIFLNSPGGEVIAGVQLAKVVYNSGIAVVVGKDRLCASMCVLVLAAGRERWAYPTAKLGVHSIGSYVGNAKGPAPEDGDDRNYTLLLARAMKFYGAPDGVIVKMIMTKPNAITGLDADDVSGWINIAIPKG